jgi:hypothetical protein
MDLTRNLARKTIRYSFKDGNVLWIENRNIYYSAIKMAAKQVWAHNALWMTMIL